MATPNEPAKKPAATPSQGVTPNPAAKPAQGKPAAKPAAAAPDKTGIKPASGKAPDPKAPAKPAAKPAAAAKGAAPAKGGKGGPPKKAPPAKDDHSGTRRLGQVFVDLGFLDEEQLWEVIEDAKTTGQQVGAAAVSRGLITDEQLLQALGEQHGLKVVNLQEVKPSAEAMALVNETMATVYKVLPLSVKDKVLTIAIGDPTNLPALDDLRNLLSVNEVVATLAPAGVIGEAIAKYYAGKEESIIDLINEIEKDPELGQRRQETSID